MNKTRLKRLGLGFLYLLLLGGILLTIGKCYGYLNKGAERSSIFHDAAISENPTVHYQIINNGNEGVKISNQTLTALTIDYLNAWRSKNKAFTLANPKLLGDHFTPNLQEKYGLILDQQQKDAIRINTCDLTHNIDVIFHNLDMSVTILEDHNVIQYQSIYLNERLISTIKDTASYRITCLQEDGNWRVRSLEKIETQLKEQKANREINLYNTEEFVGLNYTPQDTPWDLFGESINLKTIQDDLAKIKKMGASTVRVFVPYEEFGGPWVSEDKLNKLDQLLSSADDLDLSIVLTLFDFYSNYEENDWQNTDRHLRTLLSMTKGHPATIIYDIKNEPDLDMKSRGQQLVNDWLDHHLSLIQQIDPNRPVTIGWSSTESAAILAHKVDLVSFHFYNKAKDFTSLVNLLKQNIPKNKPLLLSELGMSSYRGIWNPLQFSESKQKTYVHDVVKQSREMDIGFLIWSLYDYSQVPNSVVGRLPWRKAYQRHYGILDIEGRQKPIADDLFTQSQID